MDIVPLALHVDIVPLFAEGFYMQQLSNHLAHGGDLSELKDDTEYSIVICCR